jgi:hypothetical protein
MNNIWTMSLEDYIKVMEEAMILAKNNGKKVGDNIEGEFFEIAKKKNLIPKYLGRTGMDKDLILGNLREETHLKIFDATYKKEQNENRNIS